MDVFRKSYILLTTFSTFLLAGKFPFTQMWSRLCVVDNGDGRVDIGTDSDTFSTVPSQSPETHRDKLKFTRRLQVSQY